MEATTLELSRRINSLEESATIATARKSRELKQKGLDVVSLSLGEPDFNTPDFVKNAIVKAVHENYSHYPPVNGFLTLREAISKKFKRDNNLHYSPEEIVVSTGAKQCIANVVMATINPGDEILLPAPYWVSYKQVCQLAEGNVVEIPSGVDVDYKITPQQLQNAITAKTKLLIFSSPCNPTGSTYTKEELEELARVLEAYPQILIISDEIYELISFDGSPFSIGSLANMQGRVVTVNGLSKGFAMTGYRLGYMGAPIEIAKACSKFQGQFTSGANAVTQVAAIAAVSENPSIVNEMKEVFLSRRNKMYNALKDLPGVKCNLPGGAFYLFPDISDLIKKSKQLNSSVDFCDYLLEHHLLALVAGEAFGAPGHVRISYAASDEELDKAIDRIKNAVKELAN